MSNDEKILMVCDDRAEFKFKDEPPIALGPEMQAKYDELAEELLALRATKESQAA